MTGKIATLAAAVSPAAALLPDGLKAKVEVVVAVDWHDLTGYLAAAYGKPGLCVDPLESPNDTTHEADVSKLDGFDLDYPCGKERDAHIKRLLSGGVEDYHLRGLLCVAVNEGKLPPAKYMVRVSW
jgi:hypothetical protein